MRWLIINRIALKQNESKFLMLQYAARHYYNQAEIINYYIWLLCVANIVMVKLPFLTTQNKNMFILLLSLVAIGLQLLLQRDIFIAGAMRKYIDYSLFRFKLPMLFNKYSREDLVDLSVKVKKKNPQKAEEQYSSSGSDPQRGVKDWYVNVAPSLNRNEAIFYCQKQNIWWERNLSRDYLNILRVLFIIVLIILIAIFLNKTLLDFIYFIASLAALLVKLIWEYIAIRKYRKISIESETLVQTTYEIDEQHLMTIQNKIDERRNMLFHSPDFLHKITAKRNHETIYERDTIIIHENEPEH